MNTTNTRDSLARMRWMSFGLNQQLYDMGMRDDELFDTLRIQRKIEDVDNEFDLIMIAEKIEESLVLLADQMCWPLEYVTSLTHNARRDGQKVCNSCCFT